MAANKLAISGPFADDSGALIVYNADWDVSVGVSHNAINDNRVVEITAL